MLNKFRSFLKTNGNESGMTVVEVMVAFVIIAILLVATLQAISTASRSSATQENRAKAANIASETIAIAKQIDYRQLWVPQESLGYTAADTTRDAAAHCRPFSLTTDLATTGAPQSSSTEEVLNFCKIKSFGYNNSSGGTGAGKEVGTRFHVETVVKYVNGTVNNLPKKRIEVTVRWQDVFSGENKAHEYRTTYTRSPLPSDCIDGPGRPVILGCGV